MLSKKMTVSLMSLITILALAFVVTPAMAGRFSATLDKTGDISAATGDLELEHPGDGEKITLSVEFGKAVILGKEVVSIITLDKDGKLLSLQKHPAAAEKAAAVNRTKSIPVTVEGKATTVKILIAEGAVSSADPFDSGDDDENAKLDATIRLIGADDGAPTVYSIRRAVDDTHTFAKISPKTDPVVEVRVVLSELPKKFDKTHINVTDNATVTSVRQLLPESGRTLEEILLSTDKADTDLLKDIAKYRIRKNADEAPPSDTTDTDVWGGSPTALVDVAADDSLAVRKKKETARETFGGLHRAIEEAGIIGTAYKYDFYPPLAAAPTNAAVKAGSEKVAGEFALADVGYNADNTPKVASDLSPVPPKPTDKDKSDNPKPDSIKISDYPSAELWIQAKALYATEYNAYLTYMNKKALYEGYMKALAEEKANDIEAREKAYMALTSKPALPIATGASTDGNLYPYLVVLTPKYANTDNIVVKVKAFEDRTLPRAEKYTPPSLESGYTEGVDKLTIMVSEAKTPDALTAGTPLSLPHGEGAMIPANGFYLLTKNKDGSGINYSHEKDAENLSHKQTPAQLKFNVRAAGIANLENFFLAGGIIDLVAYDGTAATAAYISEVMWGSDASQTDASNSQWIEIMNTTAAAIAIGENKWKLWFYQAHETPATSYTDGTLIDRIGTKRSDTGVFWSIVGIGRSGRTNVDPGGADVAAIAPTQALVSMLRATDAAGAPVDGTLPTSWARTADGTSANFKLGIEGTRWATPGAADITRPVAPTPTPTPTPTPAVPVAGADDIMVTEIMVNTGNGLYPQWIELTYSGTAKASLEGWEMVIDNAIDAEVLGGGNAITVSLGGVEVDVSKHAGNTGDGQSVLVTAWKARRSSSNIVEKRVINLADQLNQKSRYQLLSYNGFRITLVPPREGATIGAFGDIVGNLHEDWELPMDGRSSIIRREDLADGTETMGTDANGWILASGTSLTTGQVSFYGDDEDSGTPGHDSGGPLPVELSHFRPARDKQTGAVVITWSTQSELNNAGFFIKRSNQRDGQFQVINATMIAGAGTTSEKQTYTYMDTTAQPNVVYYYQIEDVSLDGHRQTLTRGTRLRGHIGAAGKLTATWGELKTSNE